MHDKPAHVCVCMCADNRLNIVVCSARAQCGARLVQHVTPGVFRGWPTEPVSTAGRGCVHIATTPAASARAPAQDALPDSARPADFANNNSGFPWLQLNGDFCVVPAFQPRS